MGHVFVSYARSDRAYVEKLAPRLRSAGVEVWFDYEIATGDRFSAVIKRKIETCAAMIVVMSPAAEQSEWVENEVRLARSLRKEVLPLLLDGQPFFWLSHIHYTDVHGGALPGQDFLARLVQFAVVAPTASGDLQHHGPAVAVHPDLPASLRQNSWDGINTYLVIPGLIEERELLRLRLEAEDQRPHWERRDRKAWTVVDGAQFLGPGLYWYATSGDFRPRFEIELAERLNNEIRLDVDPVQSNYLYYGPGDYLGLHHDQRRCQHSLIALLDGDAEPMCLHPELIGANPEDLAPLDKPLGHQNGVEISLADGPVLLAGRLLPYHRNPHRGEGMITIVTFCFGPKTKP